VKSVRELLERKEDNATSFGEQGPLYEESNRQRVHTLAALACNFLWFVSGIAGCRKLDAGEAQGNHQWGVLWLDAHLDPDPGPGSGQGQSKLGLHGSSMGRPLGGPVLDSAERAS
jgi:arginase family enzyme